MSLVIVRTGTANLGSVVNMCRRLGTEPLVSDDPQAIARAEKLLVPGVGAFDAGIENLRALRLVEPLRGRAAEGVPVLGVCLGMQLFFEASEEGTEQGLGLIPGVVRRLPAETTAGLVAIPHMGWSPLSRLREHSLLEGLDSEARFYFVHSYVAVPADEGDVISLSSYGDPFVSAVARGNVLGVQFHPEKSHRHGKALLGNFLGMGA